MLGLGKRGKFIMKKEILNNQTEDKKKEFEVNDNYWVDLLERIKSIRMAEKETYKSLRKLFATSVDYDSTSEECNEFFRLVQNKLHYAAHGHTAAEIINERIDANKKNMGLTSFSGDVISISDLSIAKNYLQVDEIDILNHIVSGIFEFAKINAIEHKLMYMKDYEKQLDNIIIANGRPLLDETGRITRDEVAIKIEREYKKYQSK